MSSSSRLLTFQLLLFSFWLRHLWSFISCRFLMHTTACLVVTPNAKSWVVKSTRLEFIDFIGSNSNWLTRTYRTCRLRDSTVSVIPYVNLAPLVVRCRHWLDLGFRDFVIENVCQNVMQHPIPEYSRFPKKTFEDFCFISIYIWSYKQIFAKIASSEHTWNLCTDPQRLP